MQKEDVETNGLSSHHFVGDRWVFIETLAEMPVLYGLSSLSALWLCDVCWVLRWVPGNRGWGESSKNRKLEPSSPTPELQVPIDELNPCRQGSGVPSFASDRQRRVRAPGNSAYALNVSGNKNI